MAKGNSKNVSEKALLLTGTEFVMQATPASRAPRSGLTSTSMTQTSRRNCSWRELLRSPLSQTKRPGRSSRNSPRRLVKSRRRGRKKKRGNEKGTGLGMVRK